MSNLTPTELAIDLLKKGKPVDQVVKEARLPSLGAYLFDFICKKELSVQVTAELAGLNRATLHKILNGDMNPRPNVLLRLSRVLKMNLDETQKLLKCGNCAMLSGGRPRDIHIMDGILHDRCIADIDESLTAKGFPGLFTQR